MRRSPNEQSLLSRLNSPAELRRLARDKLPVLADELRRFLSQRVSIAAADLAASLGAVELALALHYVYRTPQDRLLWDGDQQRQAHLVLSGLRPRPHAARGKGTLRAGEGKHEHFAVGHVGTSISAALGTAIAAHTQHTGRRSVAVIGPRALSAGLAFEALNHAGSLPTDLLVILNDEGGSLRDDPGLVSAQFARALAGSWYGQLRAGGKRVLQPLPTIRELARRSEKHLKGMVLPGTLFEEMGFNYTGPIDRRDVRGLVRTLQYLQRQRGPQFLHVAPGERRRRRTSGSALRPKALASVTVSVPAVPAGSFAGGLDFWACAAASRDARIVCVTPHGLQPAGLSEFARRYPERYFQIASNEQHAVTFAAGLAAEAQRPVVAVSSALLQRAYDQLIHDIALQRLPVLLALDGAGLTGADGAAHQGSFDLSYLRCIPGLCIAVPADEPECVSLLATAYTVNGPAVVRLPSVPGTGSPLALPATVPPAGRGEVRRTGKSGLALLVFGSLLESCRRIAERLDATLVNMRFVKPLDEQLVRSLCVQHEVFVTIEESAVAAGAGSAVGELLRAERPGLAWLALGIPDRFMEQATPAGRLAAAGLDPAGLAQSIERFWHTRQQQRIAAGA
jgi:1-deoxy-D-xylulose-5-phosphate synthase